MVNISKWLLLSIILVGLGACTSVSQLISNSVSGDNANKANVSGLNEDSITTETSQKDDTPIPGENDPFPTLGEMPERPELPALYAEYQSLKSELTTEVKISKKADDELRSIPTETQIQNKTPAIAKIEDMVRRAADNKIHIASLYFANGISTLSGHDKEVTKQVAALYREDSYKGLVIIGHASRPVSATVKNPTIVNKKISSERAHHVMKELERLGIPRSQMSINARGAEKLVRSGSGEGEQAHNRRVEIYFRKN